MKIRQFTAEHMDPQTFGKPEVLRIECCGVETTPDGKRKLVVVFADGRSWAMNAAQVREVAAVLGGDDTEAWQGSCIEVYCDRQYQVGGNTVEMLRARPISADA